MYALSAAIGEPVRSYYPPQFNAEFVSEPHTRKVVGRGVNKSSPPVATIMWSQTSFSDTFNPNHFVPLVQRNAQNDAEISVVNVDDDDTSADAFVDLSDDIDVHNVSVHEVERDGESDCNVNDSREESKARGDIDECQMNETKEGVVENVGDHIDKPHPLACGILNDNFLSVDELISIFENPNESKSLNHIPSGLKENVVFLLKNDPKSDSSNDSKRSFPDDCGIWDTKTGTSPKSVFLKTNDGKLKLIFLRKGHYHFQKKVKGKMTYEKIEPQPSPSNLVTIQRYYTTLKKDKQYRKRVTCKLETDSQYSICEYIGKFPGLSSHGNSKSGDSEYVRTPSAVMSEMSALLKQKTPLQVYNEMTLKHDELSGPKNKQQVRDKKNKRPKGATSLT
ncbi:hypothetical protein FSP39_014261 [Pinctada imbricata]|uniref:Uncharacterized protein n=1 Tax=Pinctada imbricata TaxID=66713 RepID=A0AA88XGQ7_PINIB|nr:hypothetical protein FSP39_014261 [Pinctada imbricata]